MGADCDNQSALVSTNIVDCLTDKHSQRYKAGSLYYVHSYRRIRKDGKYRGKILIYPPSHLTQMCIYFMVAGIVNIRLGGQTELNSIYFIDIIKINNKLFL